MITLKFNWYKQFLWASILLICLSTQSCKNDTKKAVTPPKIEFKHEGNLQLIDSIGGIKKEIQIEIADNDFEHQTGMMYRKHMDTNKGMLFIFDKIKIRSFYMKNTYISLDIIYIDTENSIINIIKNAKPMNETSLFSDAPAKYVLEINAGLSDTWKLKKGDKISYIKL